MCAEKSAYYVMKPEEQRIPENIKAFVETYEPIYFLPEQQDEANNSYLKLLGISQSRRWIEEDMETLLKPGKDWNRSDVIHILAWKMGRINHKDSVYIDNRGVYKYIGNDENNSKIVWSDGTNKVYPNLKAYNRSGDIKHIDEFVDRVIALQDRYRNGFETNQKMLEALRETLQIDTENEVTGIGSVYLITILYFIFGGKYPIYDRFAAMALKAILNGAKPGAKIRIRDLPEKQSDSFLRILDHSKSAYREYIEDLENVSEMYYGGNKHGYQSDRHLDRALWVYGHLFG